MKDNPYGDDRSKFTFTGSGPKATVDSSAKLHGIIQQMLKEKGNLMDENHKLRETLEWLDRRGGLGFDVHDRIQAALKK